MVNFDIKDGVDTTSSANAYLPTGGLIMKAMPPSVLANYDTDAECIAAGFIPCDGRVLSATTYPIYQSLFETIGNLYGGTNSTNFKVPDLRTSRRYIYGQGAVGMIFGSPNYGVYTPSFSVNTVNAVTHNHSVNSMTSETLLTNNVSGSHTHSTGYIFSDGGIADHSHLWAANMAALNTSGALGTTLTKADGTGTAAGAAHTHSTGGVNIYFNSGVAGSNHYHSGTGTSTSHTEPTHSHSFTTSNVTIPVSSAIDIPYINVLYFIKI